MPAIANLSLTNNAAVATTGVALQPSAGEGVPAIWRIETTKPPFARPTITMSARANKVKTVRRVDVKLTVPYTVSNSTTTLEEKVAEVTYIISQIVPQNVPTSLVDDSVAYCRTLLADAGVIAALKSQMAPT
jgi:hypothetical protein